VPRLPEWFLSVVVVVGILLFWILRSLRFINESGDLVSLCLRFKCFVVVVEGLSMYNKRSAISKYVI
jgi:hypothetical protein